MEKFEYAVNPLEQGNQSGDNVLLTICESSEGSQDLITTNDEVQYQIRSSDGILHYPRIICVNTLSESNSGSANENRNSATSNNGQGILESTNCEYYVINKLYSHQPCSPKVINDTTAYSRHIIGKRKDEKRRATHNEVERRRRDKINQWIFKLKDLLPNSQDAKTKANSNESKGGILIKACEYIRSMQEQNQSLKECLKESEKLTSEHENLMEENEKLRKENERLLKILEEKDIKDEVNLKCETTA